MSSRKAFRVAPSQDGVRPGSSWRFWRQGDEFYAGCREVIGVSKLSFHHDGNWQLRVGTAMEKLTLSRRVFDEWVHAISLQWLPWTRAFRPILSDKEKVTLIDVPEDSKLVVNLLLSLSKGDPPAPKPCEGGLILWSERLSDRRVLLLHVVTLPQTEQDRDEALRLRRKALITVKRIPEPGAFYSEIAWFASRPESGNTVALVPLGPDSLNVRGLCR
jgi:hypothetical protein